jgi:hypothetical protein
MFIKLPVVDIHDNHGYIIPIGDTHIADPAFTKRSQYKLQGYLDWVAERDNAKIIIMGDIYNISTRTSKTSPFGNKQDEEAIAIKLFEPVKDKIIGVLRGNHCNRLRDTANWECLLSFCRILGIEDKYYKSSQAMIVRVGDGIRGDNRWGEYYTIYAHHTTSGGNTIGGKMNRIQKLRSLVSGADIYLGAHNHAIGVVKMEDQRMNIRARKLEAHPVYYVDSGGFLEWNNAYPEEKMMEPTHIGAPRIRLSGTKHDVHISV